MQRLSHNNRKKATFPKQGAFACSSKLGIAVLQKRTKTEEKNLDASMQQPVIFFILNKRIRRKAKENG